MYRTEDFLPRVSRRRPARGSTAARLRPPPLDWLPRREREIAQIVHDRGGVTATDICAALETPISNAAVRSMLGRLERKGVVKHAKQGRRFLYMPAQSSEQVALAALSEIVARHFNGSALDAALALLGMTPARDEAQFDAIAQLSRLIRQVELD